MFTKNQKEVHESDKSESDAVSTTAEAPSSPREKSESVPLLGAKSRSLPNLSLTNKGGGTHFLIFSPRCAGGLRDFDRVPYDIRDAGVAMPHDALVVPGAKPKVPQAFFDKKPEGDMKNAPVDSYVCTII